MTQRRWRWRNCGQWAELQGSPWLRWFDHARRCLRQCEQFIAQPLLSDQDTEILDYDELEPLGYTQCVSFGETWEPDFMDDWNQFVTGSSYECGIRIVLRHTQWQTIHRYLSGFAIGQGLLLSAWQADQVSRHPAQRSTT